MTERAPSPEAVAVIAAWPNGDWLTEHQLAEHLHEQGHPIEVGPHGFTYSGRPLRSVLNEARRRSWLLRDQRSVPTIYQRTPRGATETKEGDES